MALYPYTIKNLDPQGTYEVSAGSLICHQFTIAPDSQLVATMVKVSPTQDHSLRCWFSKEPGGSSIHVDHLIAGNWHPNKVAMYSICLHSTPQPVLTNQMTTYSFPIEPGTYYLNVLNLINEPNKYAGMFVTTLDDDDM